MDAWRESGVSRGDPSSPKQPYVIAVPPPNVTGSLHMGHALNNTLQDILGGIRSACTYVGARTLRELTKRTTFVCVGAESNEIFGAN